MRKRFLPRPKQGTPHYISPKKVKGEIKLYRGDLDPTIRAAHKSLTNLGIRQDKEGRVLKPRYREKKGRPDEIEIVRKEELSNLYAALRQTRHKRISSTSEVHALGNVFRHMSVLHRQILDNWKTMDGAQRRKVVETLSTLTGAMGNPERIDSQHKKNAIQSFTQAENILIDGSHTKAAMVIARGMNDIIARINQVRRIRKLVMRHGFEFLERISKEKGRLERYLSDNFDSIARLESGKANSEEISKIIKRLSYDYASLGRKREQELKDAQSNIYRAKKSLERGDNRESIIQIRLANRKIFLALGGQYILNRELLVKVSNVGDSRLRKQILAKQIQLFADNVEYWHWTSLQKRDSTVRIQKLTSTLEQLAVVTRKDFPRASPLISEARKAVQEKMLGLAEEKLNGALKLAA